MYFYKKYQTLRHPFFLISPSEFPFCVSLAILAGLSGLVMYMHQQFFGLCCMTNGFVGLLICLYGWFKDMNIESISGYYTKAVRRGLKCGMILFIISEVMFFVSFFWAFFHSSLAPAMEIGFIWPPLGIETFDPWSVPLINTFILLTSGATVTCVHLSVIVDRRSTTQVYFFLTLGLALCFTTLQWYEYENAPFDISDGIYGSVFYLATGFHGFHVIVGTIFIQVCSIRYDNNLFNSSHSVGLECAIWYWHFVDVVWICLFITIYWW